MYKLKAKIIGETGGGQKQTVKILKVKAEVRHIFISLAD